jgi:ribosome recycling factor
VTTFIPEAAASVAKAIESNGYNAYVFAKGVVMVSIPPASGEEKEKCRKHIDKLGESARIALRVVRAKARQTSNKDEHKQIDKLTDAANTTITDLVESKKASL